MGASWAQREALPNGHPLGTPLSFQFVCSNAQSLLCPQPGIHSLARPCRPGAKCKCRALFCQEKSPFLSQLSLGLSTCRGVFSLPGGVQILLGVGCVGRT